MIIKFDGTILVITPLHHGGNEKTGSTPTLRSMMFFSEGINDFIMIPYIHGNSIRGKFKRLLMKDFFDRIGLKVSDIKPKLYHTLFSGGVLESTEKTTGIMNLEKKRKMIDLLPTVSLFGCAIGNDMIHGKLIVDHAMPVCVERKDFSGKLTINKKQVKLPIRSFTSEEFITRKDDLHAERKDDEQATQMKVDYEVFIPGTLFQHGFKLVSTNEIENSCFGRLIELIHDYPYLGGKSSSGVGQCLFEYSPLPLKPDVYFKFIDNNKDKIMELIKELEKDL